MRDGRKKVVRIGRPVMGIGERQDIEGGRTRVRRARAALAGIAG